MRLKIAFILLLTISLRVFGQETSNALRDNVMQVNSQNNAFVYDLESAVAKYIIHQNTLYQVDARYNWDSGQELFIDALGSGERSGGLGVDVAHRLNPSTLFYADAEYKRTDRADISLNSVADFERLYPYIMRDSVGGDLDSEQYRFTLGYIQSTGRFLLGADFRYLAGHNYRLVDPRPRSITSDINIGGTVAYQFRGYTLATEYEYSYYTQNNNVEIYNILGGAIQYHYLGLGTHSERFSGISSSSLMRGDEHNLSLSIAPQSGYGLFASATYKKENYEKILNDHSNLPLNFLDNSTYSAKAAYRLRLGEYDLSAKAEIEQHNRIGIEQSFGSAANSYPPISKVEAFEMTCNTTDLSLLIERNISKQFRVGLLSGVELFDASIKRYDSSIKWSDLSPKAQLFINYMGDRMWGTLSIASQYRSPQNGGAEHNLSAHVVDDFDALLTPLWSNGASFDLYIKLNGRIALKVGTHCSLAKYEGYDNTYLLQHSLGVVF